VDLICIDLEASGLGPQSYPIEIAWKDATSGEQDSFLIDPETTEGWLYWDEFAEELHGIDRQELVDKGLSVTAAVRRLNEKLKGRMVVSDAWEFDRFWLSRLFDAVGVTPEFELQALEHVLTDSQLVQYRFIARSQMRRHRAANDVDDQLAAIAAVTCESDQAEDGAAD